jgi:hypothetical protein
MSEPEPPDDAEDGLYAGLLALPWPTTAWGALWRAADLLREHRGDSHLASWLVAGLDPVEPGLLNELYYEIELKLSHRTRGWTDSELDAALERLHNRGLITLDPVAFTEAGRALREEMEVNTDRWQRPIIDALGGDFDELLSIVEPSIPRLLDARLHPTRIEQFPAGWGIFDPD